MTFRPTQMARGAGHTLSRNASSIITAHNSLENVARRETFRMIWGHYYCAINRSIASGSQAACPSTNTFHEKLSQSRRRSRERYFIIEKAQVKKFLYNERDMYTRGT
jgi:hypothetical protein